MKNLKLFLVAVMLMTGFSVLAQVKTPKDLYPNPMGNLRFISPQVNLQNVNNTDTKTDTLKMYNDWTKTMTMSFSKLPDYITVKAVPESLKPGQKGYVLVTYNAQKRNDYGYMYDRFTIQTNDSLQPEKTVTISVNIVEDFSKLTPEQLLNAPKIKFENPTYDFGTIKQGDKAEYDFVFTNVGKSELIIRKTKGSCGCTVGTPEKSNLMPGESSKMHVTFNSAGKSGEQSKTVTVTCNDPSNAAAMVTIKGKVEVPAPTQEGTPTPTPTH